jgi:hypothetical protein
VNQEFLILYKLFRSRVFNFMLDFLFIVFIDGLFLFFDTLIQNNSIIVVNKDKRGGGVETY